MRQSEFNFQLIMLSDGNTVEQWVVARTEQSEAGFELQLSSIHSLICKYAWERHDYISSSSDMGLQQDRLSHIALNGNRSMRRSSLNSKHTVTGSIASPKTNWPSVVSMAPIRKWLPTTGVRRLCLWIWNFPFV